VRRCYVRLLADIEDIGGEKLDEIWDGAGVDDDLRVLGCARGDVCGCELTSRCKSKED
jgi:hypothetical protein